jgi:hypothetical protein
MGNPKNRARIAPLIVIFFIGLFPLLERHRFEAVRAVDVLQLIGSGMCLGAALALFITWRKSAGE